jgi:hypothetical protein
LCLPVFIKKQTFSLGEGYMIVAKRPFALLRMFFACTIAAVGCLPLAGCGTISQSLPNPLSSMQTGFGSKENDKAFRQRVEKDNFPTASQAGLEVATRD